MSLTLVGGDTFDTRDGKLAADSARTVAVITLKRAARPVARGLGVGSVGTGLASRTTRLRVVVAHASTAAWVKSRSTRAFAEHLIAQAAVTALQVTLTRFASPGGNAADLRAADRLVKAAIERLAVVLDA